MLQLFFFMDRCGLQLHRLFFRFALQLILFMKRRGFQLERSRVRDHAHLDRLLLVLAIATWWSLSLGLHVVRAGHRRRYEPERLVALLAAHGFGIDSSAVHGMQPQSSWLLEFGMWGLTHRRQQAMWLYNRVLMPLGIWFQKKLEMHPGLIDTRDVDTVLLVCRKAPAGG